MFIFACIYSVPVVLVVITYPINPKIAPASILRELQEDAWMTLG